MYMIQIYRRVLAALIYACVLCIYKIYMYGHIRYVDQWLFLQKSEFTHNIYTKICPFTLKYVRLHQHIAVYTSIYAFTPA